MRLIIISNNILKLYIPFSVFLLTIFNTLLVHFGIQYLYVVPILFGIIGMLISGIRKLNGNANIILIYMYILSLIIVFLVQLFTIEHLEYSIKSFFMYVIFIIYWTIYFNKYHISDYRNILKKAIPFVYIIGLLGCVQYFLSPTLFGLLDTNISKGIEWASNLSFLEYSAFFRASSSLGSPQVYGLFMALMIVVMSSLNSSKIGLFFLFGAGMLSGNKSFILIVAIYFLYKFIFSLQLLKKIKILIVGMISIILLSMLTPDSYFENFRVINRVINIDSQIEQENKDSRIDRYNMIISESTVFGNGLGVKSNTQNVNRKVAESYLFQILYEAGVIVVVIFLMFLAGSFIFGKEKKFPDIKILVFLIFISMIVVHAFNSPIFFIIWGVLISSYSNIKTKGMHDNNH